MLTPFKQLSPNSRIWIYQSDRAIGNSEQQEILAKSEAFIGQWAAHGQSLLASSQVLHDHFLVIATDEGFHMASGCSIDSSFRFVQELGTSLKINFFERTNLAFLIDGNVELVKMNALKEAIASGIVTDTTQFFNNNINTVSELQEKWIVKASESWLKRYFNPTVSVI